jgi:hypothetical protein
MEDKLRERRPKDRSKSNDANRQNRVSDRETHLDDEMVPAARGKRGDMVALDKRGGG